MGAAGAAVASTPKLGSNVPETWDMESDLVIIGGGGAGYMAALSASELGASSIILEKNDHSGGDTAVCAQIFVGPCPKAAQSVSGQQDSVGLWLEDQVASYPFSRKGIKGLGAGDTSLVELQGSLTEETYDWLRDTAGVVWTPFDYCFNAWTPSPSWDTVYPRDWIVLQKHGIWAMTSPSWEIPERQPIPEMA